MKLEIIHNIPGPDGRTIKERNMELVHNIPLGTLVEVKFNKWFGDGACMKVHARLWVVKHTRDCDGTPLYSLRKYNGIVDNSSFLGNVTAYHGFDESGLTPIELTQEVIDGYGALEWEEE